jgi:hypothetical protein
MDKDIIEIQYKYSEIEAINATREITKSVSFLVRIFPYMGYIMLGLFISMWILSKEFPSDLFLLIFGIVLSCYPLIVLYQAKRNFKKNPSANTTVKYIIDDSTIEIQTEGSEGKYSWEKIFRVEKRKKGMLIFPQSRIAHWIPSSVLNAESISFLEKIIFDKGIKYKKIS